MNDSIENFFDSEAFAVAGASADRCKYGNKVLRCYMQNHKRVYPIHPSLQEIEGLKVYAKVLDLPDNVKSLSIITPPPVTEKIIEELALTDIQHVWMQPGAESQKAIKRCQDLGIELIAQGPCILVYLGFHDI